MAESPGLANSLDGEGSSANAPSVSSAGAKLNWPQVHTNNSVVIAIYPPQIEKWEGEDLESRSAAAITPLGETKGLAALYPTLTTASWLP